MSERIREQLRDEEHYVLLLPSLEEQFLSREELQVYLKALIEEYPDCLELDLRRYTDPGEQVQRLIDITCELTIAPGQAVQWYAVRLQK